MELTAATITATILVHARNVIKKNCLHVKEDEFVIEVKDLLSDSIVCAGNPVKIVIGMHTFVEAMNKRNFYDFNQMLEDALRKVPKMHRTLSVVPVADVLKWNEEMRRFRKASGIPEDYIPEVKYKVDRKNLVVTYITQVNVHDIESGKRTSAWAHSDKFSTEEIEEMAIRKLERMIVGELVEEDDEG